MKAVMKAVFAVLALFGVMAGAQAQKISSLFIDANGNVFDLSEQRSFACAPGGYKLQPVNQSNMNSFNDPNMCNKVRSSPYYLANYIPVDADRSLNPKQFYNVRVDNLPGTSTPATKVTWQLGTEEYLPLSAKALIDAKSN